MFLGVLVVAGAASLIYNYSRPAEYRASARVQINPGAVQVESMKALGGSQGTDAQRPLMTELQVLTSRPVVEAAAERLSVAMPARVSALGADPVTAMQASLQATSAADTDVVELVAAGPDPELTAALVNSVIGTYKERLEQSYRDTSGEALERINDELAKVQARVAEKRRLAEAFRQRHDVVSLEREENQLLARTRGQATALNNANEKLATAEGRLRSLEEAAAQGRSVVRARDNPTLAALEARASQIREELRELGRRYTPDYLDADPNARVLRARLAELEEQIKAQRALGQSSALEEAEQELAAARESARRLQQQISASRQQVGAFAARFGQYKSLREELAQLEKTYQEAQQRQARLGATERSRMPAVQVLEQAVIPKEAWRPLYWRDAGLIAGGALLLALGAMWLVELFNRPTQRPSVLVTQPVFAGTLLPGQALPELSGPNAHRQLTIDDRPRLAAPLSLPRELTVEEAAALLQGADADTRGAVALLLSGLSTEEVLALRWSDVDADAALISVGGAQPRKVPVPAGALPLLGERPADATVNLLRGAEGGSMSAESLAAKLLVAAHDAGIERAQEVTPEALRHTYLAFLVRQGARFADITRWVGPLGADLLSAYSQLAPPGARLEASDVRRLFPALAQANGA